ncbi:hypothetical protein [Geminicoccus harenae]|uniref:hypothetical protein n=1 Tax=Geminicoccus harenae TaxID=2498453 RepID=UPI001C97CAF6|nr:hypothetical protein [Geminicoccus harenae]
MTRLLGPEEAKYWLLGHACPFNIVLAFGVEEWRAPDRLAVPVILPDADGLPRWGGPSVDGRIERGTGSWAQAAEALLCLPVGMAGAPAWRLRVVEEAGETVVLLALHHALIDARGGLALVGHLLDGRFVPPLPPAFEELLADEAWPDPSVQDEVLGWWSRRMTGRLRSLDLAKLAALLPRPEPARLAVDRLPPVAFGRLRARCRSEGATLHGALVAALPADTGSKLGHAVDMRRFLPPPLAEEAWLALSHLETGLPAAGPFWERARAASDLVRTALASGAAGAALAELPRTLAGDRFVPPAAPPLTVSNGGRHDLPAGSHGRATWYMALAGANAGAPVLAASGAGEALLVASVTPAGRPPLPLDRLVEELAAAASA